VAEWTDKKQLALSMAWATHRTWDETANHAAAEIRRARWWILVLTILGAVLSTAGQFFQTSAPGWQKGLGIAGGIVVAVATYFTREVLSDDLQRRWLRARGAAEAAKSETYAFRLGFAPYDGTDAPQKLETSIQSQRKLVTGVPHQNLNDEQLAVGLPQGPLNIDAYVEGRVEQQISWYEKRVGEYESKVASIRRSTVILGGLSAVAGAMTGLLPPMSIPIPLFGLLIATLNGYVTANRYSYLITSYSVAADQLRDLREEWLICNDQSDLNTQALLVKHCEAAISAENAAWMAKLSEKTADSQQAEQTGEGASGKTTPQASAAKIP
jgi:hypothetical protein